MSATLREHRSARAWVHNHAVLLRVATSGKCRESRVAAPSTVALFFESALRGA